MAFIIADRVKETTTTTGTGALTLAGTLTGFTTFAARCAVGDTLYYAIQAVDGTGAPTGEWECGLGTYSDTNTLTRTTVTSSSNSDAAVSFAAGTKQVFITMPAVQARWARERLTADRTYYVRTDGSDTNTGLVNTSGGAFLTIQQALDVATSIDNAGFLVTVLVGAGTYTGGCTLKTITGAGKILIRGAVADMTSTVISTTSADCINFGSGFYGTYELKFLKLQAAVTGSCISTIANGVLVFSNLNFGASPENHIVLGVGTFVQATGPYTISGGTQSHAAAYDGGQLRIQSLTITISGAPAFSGGFATVGRGGSMLANDLTFSGTATGKRYASDSNGILFTGGAGTTYFPGDVAGTTATGGLYV